MHILIQCKHVLLPCSHIKSKITLSQLPAVTREVDTQTQLRQQPHKWNVMWRYYSNSTACRVLQTRRAHKTQQWLQIRTVPHLPCLEVYPACPGGNEWAESAWAIYRCYCWTAASKDWSVASFCDCWVGEERFAFLHCSHLKRRLQRAPSTCFQIETWRLSLQLSGTVTKEKKQQMSPPNMFM